MLQSIAFRISLKLHVTANRLRGAARGISAVTLAATALALPVAALAHPITWVGISRDFDKLVLYLDPASITREASTEKAWLLFDFLAPQAAPGGLNRYQSLKVQVTVRCTERSYARTKEIKYSGLHANGRVVGAYTWPPSARHFEKAVPLTNSQSVVDSVCRAAPVRSQG